MHFSVVTKQQPNAGSAGNHAVHIGGGELVPFWHMHIDRVEI
jgi:hypothetical protein